MFVGSRFTFELGSTSLIIFLSTLSNRSCHPTDNEYVQTPAPRAEYIAQLEATYKAHGVAVPLTYNDPGPRRAFLNGTGAPDIYGMDAYPLGFDCSHPDVWAPSMLDTDYRRYHVDVDPARPWYIPEWQAGSYDPWGGSGYDKCAQLTGPQFQDTFNKQTWASNAKLLNHYMFYGCARLSRFREFAMLTRCAQRHELGRTSVPRRIHLVRLRRAAARGPQPRPQVRRAQAARALPALLACVPQDRLGRRQPRGRAGGKQQQR